MTVGQNIARMRKERKWTQTELGEMLGVSNQAVSKWEAATTSPDISLLPMLADAFECSIDDLFDYLPKSKWEKLNVIPGNKESDATDEIKAYIRKQVRRQFDYNGSTDQFLSIMEENHNGIFELTDENIERVLSAYRELYKGMRQKKITHATLYTIN